MPCFDPAGAIPGEFIDCFWDLSYMSEQLRPASILQPAAENRLTSASAEALPNFTAGATEGACIFFQGVSSAQDTDSIQLVIERREPWPR